MKIIKGIQKTPEKVVVYGPEGIGKSTFLSCFPEPLFIDTEGSTKHMNVSRLPNPQSWMELLEEIMDYEDSLGVDMGLSDLEEWDSLSTLALAAKVKELYGENLTNDEIQNFKTVKDICDYLK